MRYTEFVLFLLSVYYSACNMRLLKCIGCIFVTLCEFNIYYAFLYSLLQEKFAINDLVI